MLRSLVLAGILAAAASAALAGPALAARPLGLPQGRTVLFTVQAEGGSLAPVRGKAGRFVLTLRDVAPQGIWFTDRPTRDTGSLRVASFFGDWKKLGFRADPPNAVISLVAAKDKADTFAVELGTPRYDARTRTARVGVRALDTLSPGLASLGPDLDARLPARFGETALFIDDVRTTASQGSMCGYLAQLDVYPSGLDPAAYLPADGRLLPLHNYTALFALMDTVFGGDGRNSFGVPNLTGPIPFLAYQLCSDGYFPARADDDYDNGAMCDVGSIVLEAQSFQPAGWVAADGRSLQVAQAPMLFAVLGTTFGGDGTTTFNVPTVPAPKGLKYWVCANGDPWKPGARTSNTCTISSVTLFGTTNLPGNFMPADGRLLPINQFQVLYSLYSNNFGGDGIQTFALPKVPPPVPGTAYGVCSQGFYPQRS